MIDLSLALTDNVRTRPVIPLNLIFLPDLRNLETAVQSHVVGSVAKMTF